MGGIMGWKPMPRRATWDWTSGDRGIQYRLGLLRSAFTIHYFPSMNRTFAVMFPLLIAILFSSAACKTTTEKALDKRGTVHVAEPGDKKDKKSKKKDKDAAARDAAAKGLASLKDVDMALVTGKDHMAWMEHAGALKSLFTAISETDGIEPARLKFAVLSEEIVVVLARFGMSEGPLYKAWCPMAFDNRGASWVQSEEEISNPYFGAMMLRCGEIKEVLK